jgi:hypothetical protein
VRGTCDTCKYYFALQPECRKNAPVVFLRNAPDGTFGTTGVFLPTRPDWWRGEHVVDIVSSADANAKAVRRAM